MKKLLLLLVILPMFCLAQSSTKKNQEAILIKAQCYSTDVIAKQLLALKEQPLIMGKVGDTANSVMSLWTNLKTGAWTLVASKGDTSCVLGNGFDLTLIDPGEVI